jgi:hypothetical protein
MGTTKQRYIEYAIVFSLCLFALLGSAFSIANAAGIGLNLFTIGGPSATQITPIFPSWSLNVPLSPPTISAATTTGGGSLTAGSALYFRVAATNGTGTTTASNEIATTTANANQQINITWPAVPGATKYFVFFSTSTAGAEGAYFAATTSSAYDFTSTSSPTGYGTIPGFPSSFAVQLSNSATPIVVNGVNFAPIATTTVAIGGGALGAGGCAAATSTIAGLGTVSSSTVFITTPAKYPGNGTTWQSWALNSTQIVTQVCALQAGTPVSTVYNVRAI